MATWYYPKDSTNQGAWSTAIEVSGHQDEPTDGWAHTGLKVGELHPGRPIELPPAAVERVIVPLSGSLTVYPDGADGIGLQGRKSVWAGPTDIAYVGAGQGLALSGTGRVAICEAVVSQAAGRQTRPPAYLPAQAVPVELRGAGACTREVRNFATPGTLEADSIIACEVITPAGNWSSYPPHKHDEELVGVETALEEIYYFELRQTDRAAGPGAPIGYQRVSASPGRAIDLLAEVHDQDVVLVPFGWHGPSMAAPGYDMYYLNVMAGPGRERAWRITDHPDQAWVRQTWAGQPTDPRLPMRG